MAISSEVVSFFIFCHVIRFERTATKKGAEIISERDVVTWNGHHKVDRAVHDGLVKLLKSIVAAAIRSKPVGRVYKVLLKDRFKNLLNCHPDNIVLDSWESKRYFLAIWLWDVDSARPVEACTALL